MLLTLMHSIALLGAASHSAPWTATQVPGTLGSLPSAIRSADVPARIEITTTHFLAKSLVQESQWLVFTNAERGLVRVRAYAPLSALSCPSRRAAPTACPLS